MAEAFITVSLAAIAKEAMGRLPSRDDQNRMVQGLGAAAMAYWKRQAKQNLRSTSRAYIQGLSSETSDRTFTITLAGVLPNLVENGYKGGDMRQWMFGGPKAKQGKNGKYLVVPFQHGTPGTSGRNVGPPMPTSIYAAAAKLAPTLSRPRRASAASAATNMQLGGGRSVKYGGRLTEHSRHLSTHARKLLTTKMKPWHASSVFRGMIREQKTFKKATQTTGYTTFRTISENVNRGASDAQGQATEHWYHPGISAAHFAQKTQRHLRRIAHDMLGPATEGQH